MYAVDFLDPSFSDGVIRFALLFLSSLLGVFLGGDVFIDCFESTLESDAEPSLAVSCLISLVV